jgi:hypothetical protein
MAASSSSAENGELESQRLAPPIRFPAGARTLTGSFSMRVDAIAGFPGIAARATRAPGQAVHPGCLGTEGGEHDSHGHEPRNR